MNGLLTLVIAIVRAWVGTYTRGLPADLRAERREEIDCDLWEHHRLVEIERITPSGAAAQILFRFIPGVPEDIFWRVEASASVAKGRTSVNDTLFMRVGYGVAMLGLLFLVVNGIGIMFGGGDFESSLGHVVWGLAFLVCPLVVMIGLYLCASRPKLGLWMVVGGVVASVGIMFWMAFITVPLGLLVIAFATKRAGYTVWPFSRGASPA